MAAVKCPLCGRTFDSEQSPAMPFCSHRCRLLDLKRWLDEEYGFAREPEDHAEEPDAESEEPEG